ncbi:MAG: thioredoxin domain-containing protein [Crenarchaeota archaeon]|nr:thioredoxin domain-containing protein [Thermoproteota archaeon]MDA1124364.1 thioredoxin domain-containing protein [Thermoproteota archaeon]
MEVKDSDKDFTFSIEGKEYTISEKDKIGENNATEISKKQTLHVPSLTIGAIISGICIAIVVFGIGDLSESSSPLIEKQLVEKQLVEEQVKPTQITTEIFFENGSPILGNPDAEITLVEFGDYQCHFCNVYFHNTEHEIYEKYVMTGKVNVIFKDYTIIGQDSVWAAHGAHCASEQGKFWEYHNTLYNNWGGENNGWASSENISRFAEEIGLNMDEFVECNVDKRYEQKITASNADAQKLGITGTPAFYVISANSQQVQTIFGAQPYEVFEKIFNSMREN